MELDRISSLPYEVTENILLHLPLREAVRTSVLSTRWRYNSAMLQDLTFNEHEYPDDDDDDDDDDDNHQMQTSFVNIVDHVLLLHIGPIRKFVLIAKEVATRHIDRWLAHLSRNSIKELALCLWVPEYHIPLCVFSCQDLVFLELIKFFLMDPNLTEVWLKPPSTFKGFRNLKSLHLVGITMSQNVFETLICCSPMLERLIMRHCYSVDNINLYAPNLKFLDIMGIFGAVSLKSTPNLIDASIGVTIHTDGPNQRWVPARWVPSSSGNLVKIFDKLSQIRRLAISLHFLKYLSRGALPEKLPTLCEYLDVLSIDICFDDTDEILAALCVLRSSPALQELEILMDGRKKLTTTPGCVEEDESSYSDVLARHNFKLPRLRLVKINKISGVKAELHFIRFLLLGSPLLEKMTITVASVDGFPEVAKELLKCKRASNNAEIILLDPS